MLKSQKLTRKQSLFIVFAACCIVSFFAAAVILSSPSIKINGSEHVYISMGEKYVDPGAVAKDMDGNRLPVGISGNVDNSTPGDNEIVYRASHMGRTVTASRIVTVREQ